MQTQGAVLIIEDDASIRLSLRMAFCMLNFDVREASNGEDGLESMRVAPSDVVLLDINMPGIGGIETCRRLRACYPHLPILMLSVRGSEDDKVEALESGADDYVTKPFQVRELIARVRAAMRRVHEPSAAEGQITVRAITLDIGRRRVTKSGDPISLTPKEFETLRFLMEHAGRPVTHRRLLRAVWGPQYGNEREYLRVMIRQLRVKLEDDPSRPTYLRTEAYIGYRFSEDL